jgi:hypothetical protein
MTVAYPPAGRGNPIAAGSRTNGAGIGGKRALDFGDRTADGRVRRPTEPRQAYLDRVAEIDARVGAVRADPAVLLERAAGMVAGRVGCRVDEARAYLLRMASDNGRDRHELAAEVLAALEPEAPGRPRRMRAMVDRALRAPQAHAAASAPAGRAGADRADWVEAVQRVLDAMPGTHSLLIPVRDDAGEVVD